ncbi:hypothetical protein Hanom_Chr17g01589991 [Helianthus anomalus]
MDELNVSLCRPSQICEGVSTWEWSGSALDREMKHLNGSLIILASQVESETRHADPNYAFGFREPVPINWFRPKYVSLSTTLVHLRLGNKYKWQFFELHLTN